MSKLPVVSGCNTIGWHNAEGIACCPLNFPVLSRLVLTFLFYREAVQVRELRKVPKKMEVAV